MTAVRIGRRSRPKRVAGDKGYSYPRIRRWLRRHRIEAVIPQRSDQQAQHRGRPLTFDKDAYRRRSVIECCIGWLKECRRIGTRFEKLALNFLAMIKLAIICRYLRVFDLSDRAWYKNREGVSTNADRHGATGFSHAFLGVPTSILGNRASGGLRWPCSNSFQGKGLYRFS